MNYYELAKEVHANAVAKGFWDELHSPNHYFMLAITELSEAVEAHRKGRTASIPEGIEDFPDKAFIPSFEAHIKDTIEDELADTTIRLLDLYGSIIEEDADTIDLSEDVNENYKLLIGLDGKDLPELAYEAVCYLCESPIIAPLMMKFYNALCCIMNIAERLGIDLERHVRLKMRYNATRPRLHGKKY
nr:MAG TPA: NTP-PPase-like protein [Caudoviricetes sp.]